MLENKAKGEIGQLPIEIIYDILVRLPMDALSNCTSVCKPWNSLIKSAPFTLCHLEFTLLARKKDTKEKDDLLMVYAQHKRLDLRHGEIFISDCVGEEYTKRHVIPIPNITPAGSQKMIEPIGTCNGLICLVCWIDFEVWVPILWNPHVRKILVLPTPRRLPDVRVSVKNYTLCYDLHSKDFKLLEIVTPEGIRMGLGKYRLRLFSLCTFSWKDLETPDEDECTPVEMFGAFHWICSKPRHMLNESTVVVTFNLSTELFGQMEFPEALKNKKRWPSQIIHKLNYRGSFAFLAWGTQTSDLWVMKEYGVAKSWTKVLTMNVCLSPVLGHLPIYFTKGDPILLGTNHEGVFSIDLKRKDVKCILDDRLSIKLMDPFFGTLVLLDRTDALSY